MEVKVKDERGNEITRKSRKKDAVHLAAVIGDTVGDPLKDTSGPSLNILIKLMAIISLVFARSFPADGYLVRALRGWNVQGYKFGTLA